MSARGHDIHPGTLGLVCDGIALNEALISDDLMEARFLIRLIAADALALGLMEVHDAACWLVCSLGLPQDPPSPDYPEAAFALSLTLTEARHVSQLVTTGTHD
ncbi:hypothetical protein SAMN02800694_1647 [Luteibacter sp. UNCMF331Sha3.1]|uniref:hypothetical protein n=1 Tax=Luteibacter sp. UNCMF331Sha3.1 TaxID=1502760 RepID=UPI0008B9BCC5|nr:hypothetical protein [Luteibacter sp. UNCMF331Sha3.1]SEM59616.1 hypothetical protein SAMN02800694_1647 [Luteibacter sp. UNCMF331Sha3.1]